MFDFKVTNTQPRQMKLSGKDDLVKEALRIKVELKQGMKKPFTNVLDLSSGDPQGTGMKPLSFVRQVIAACVYPELVQSDRLPADVRRRAQKLLQLLDGGSVGSYTVLSGVTHIQHSVAAFITRRDGGIPSLPENIFITHGSQRGLMTILQLLVHGKSQTGVLTPVPSYTVFVKLLETIGATMVPYYLREERGWSLHVEELRHAVQAYRERCTPKVLYVVNPGNPAGYVQSRRSIEEIIRFAVEERLLLLVDEVYQDSVYGEGREFVSYKRVLYEMGAEYFRTVQLASIHSVSKSFMGECGFRAGYLELLNVEPAVMEVIEVLHYADLCTPVIGQIALDIMADPPQPGDPSYTQYTEEVQSIQDTFVHNAQQAQSVLNSLPGISCQPVQGGIYIFPRLHLPPAAVEQAREANMEPDMLYCRRLLEEAGVCVSPGSEHGQQEGTHHFRICVRIPPEMLADCLRRLTQFQLRFMSEFSSTGSSA